jgi:hypothetical protein
MIEVSATLELDKKTMKVLEKFPSKFLYSMASQTLDLGYTTIPLSDQKNRGRLRSSSRAYGVKQHTENDFSIGSQTDYAAYVWIMNNETTNWTTQGTGSEWYKRTLKEKKDLMVANAIKEAEK